MSALHSHILTPLRRGPWTPRRVRIVSAYRRARRAFEEWQWLSVDERRVRTTDALTRLLRHAATVPYYREMLHANSIEPSKPIEIEQWQRLPVLEKAALRERGDDLIPTTTRYKWLRADSTGGSTGAPVTFKLGPIQQGWRWAAQEHLTALCGFRPGQPAAYLWGGDVDPDAKPSLTARLSNFLVNQQLYNCFRLDAAVFEGIHVQLAKNRPWFLVGYASALALFAHYLEGRGITPGYPARAVLTGAEKLEASARTVISRVFRVPVYETYGSRDCGAMALQADPAGPLIVAAPYVLLEPYGEAAEDGSREILVTHLEPSDGTVMIRYRVGDRARFADDGPFPSRLHEVTGRVLDNVRLPSGKIIHSTQFPHLFKDYDIVEYQVVQSKDGSVVASLVAGPTLDESQQRALGHRLSRMIPEVPVSVKAVPAIERSAAGKRRPVISHYVGADSGP